MSPCIFLVVFHIPLTRRAIFHVSGVFVFRKDNTAFKITALHWTPYFTDKSLELSKTYTKIINSGAHQNNMNLKNLMNKNHNMLHFDAIGK